MSAFRSPKRQVPKPDLVGPHNSVNPIFDQPQDWSAFRSRVVGYTGLGLVVTALGFLIYGPWFAIRAVQVSGTRLLDPASIQRTTEKYLDDQRWLVLPNRTIWIVSAHGLSQYLEKQIRQRISIDQVTVEKKIPHKLNIVIAERTPVATWTNDTAFGSVDKEGKIIEMLAAADPNFPIIRDENHKMFGVDTSVVKQIVIEGWQTLVGEMNKANIQVSEYRIPIPVCPPPIIPETNTNSSNTNLNTNTTTNKNVNTNTSAVLQNANVSIPVARPCDQEALRYASQEIHAQLVEGPRVLFDRHADLKQAVQGLQRVLAERSTKVYKIIDVRFGDRVYVQ